MPADQPTLLVVCTGNVCRSPYVELSLADRLASAGVGDLRVESAGTAALVGSPVAGPIGTVLQRDGVDTSAFRARQLEVAHLDRASLVVTATREHRAEVARLRPRVLQRLFTLRQLGRLLDLDGEAPAEVPEGERDLLRHLARAAARQRGRVSSSGEDDDVLDPYGRSAEDYALSVEQMRPGVDSLVRALVRTAAG